MRGILQSRADLVGRFVETYLHTRPDSSSRAPARPEPFGSMALDMR
jgi:hypothetical protein